MWACSRPNGVNILVSSSLIWFTMKRIRQWVHLDVVGDSNVCEIWFIAEVATGTQLPITKIYIPCEIHHIVRVESI